MNHCKTCKNNGISSYVCMCCTDENSYYEAKEVKSFKIASGSSICSYCQFDCTLGECEECNHCTNHHNNFIGIEVP